MSHNLRDSSLRLANVWLEALPAMIGAGILIAIHRRFRFTPSSTASS